MFGMNSAVASSRGRWPQAGRSVRILLGHLTVLMLLPNAIFALGLFAARHAEWISGLLVIPVSLYCVPVVAVFGGSHFSGHAGVGPMDWTGCAKVILFYTLLAIVTSGVHLLCIRHKGRAELCAAPNGGPATPVGNSDIAEGPPSVS